jgi:hypothetical protein
VSDLPKNVDRVFDLAGAMCDETASEDEFVELDSIVVADETSRRYYWGYCWMHLTLGKEGRAQRLLEHVRERNNLNSTALSPWESDTLMAMMPSAVSASTSSAFPSPASPLFTTHGISSYFASEWSVAYLLATVILAIGLSLGALVPVSRPGLVAERLPTTNREEMASAKMDLVGRITGMVGCQWSAHATEAVKGVYVPRGHKYALASGLMEITYNTGAKVILQGPVTYEVESKNGGFLRIGKLTGRVEGEMAKGFTVRTPTATVTDLGTEFGVEVRDTGGTSAHVFSGAVDVQTAAHDGQQAQSVRLRENESVQLEPQSGRGVVAVQRGKADSAAFVRIGKFSQRAEEHRLRSFQRWQAYSQELRKDPSLVAYYDFQQEPGLPAVLRNVAANGDSTLDGGVKNATWTTGQMPGKHALLFQNLTDSVQVNLRQAVSDLTVTAWVQVPFPGSEAADLLVSDQWRQKGQIHLSLSADGRMIFDVYDSTRQPDIGPGNVVANYFRDWGPSYGFPVWTILDTSRPQTLAAGTYRASSFGHEFAGNGPADAVVQPFLATLNATTGVIVPVAVGSAVTATATSGFVSPAFGGSDTFTLAASTPIYAGFAWTCPTATGPVNCALGSDQPSAGRFSTIRYSTAMPAVGVPITQLPPYAQFSEGYQNNTYDFSIAVAALGTNKQLMRSEPYQSAPFADRRHLCRWAHVAVVYDHAAARIRFYVDGRAAGDTSIVDCVPICIGAARIGNWSDRGDLVGNEERRLRWQMIDELAIFGRPLTPAQIQRMYEAGKP